MKGKTLIVVLFLAVAGVIVYLSFGRKGGGPTGTPGGTPPAPGAAGAPAPATTATVRMLYGTEKTAFIEEMAGVFRQQHPEVKLELTAAGSLEAADRILDGRETPTVFSPGDSLVLGMLAADWQTKNGKPLFAADGEEAPQPLLITPLCFVAWEDRARVLEKAGTGRLGWKGLHKALSGSRGWAGLGGGDPEWGFVKLGHTDPTRSNSGLMTLLSIATEFHGGRRIAVADLLEPPFQTFLREIEKSVTRFEPSTGTFMTDMVRFGPSKYDIAVVYESLAIAQIENAQGRWGNLRVYYPTPTFWSDHPVALVDPTRLAPADRAASLAWIRFLLGSAAQGRALAFGFRPADPAVPLKTADPKNPFTRLAPFGLKVELPPAAPVAEAAVVHNLLTLWTRLGLR